MLFIELKELEKNTHCAMIYLIYTLPYGFIVRLKAIQRDVTRGEKNPFPFLLLNSEMTQIITIF